VWAVTPLPPSWVLYGSVSFLACFWVLGVFRVLFGCVLPLFCTGSAAVLFGVLWSGSHSRYDYFFAYGAAVRRHPRPLRRRTGSPRILPAGRVHGGLSHRVRDGVRGRVLPMISGGRLFLGFSAAVEGLLYVGDLVVLDVGPHVGAVVDVVPVVEGHRLV